MNLPTFFTCLRIIGVFAIAVLMAWPSGPHQWAALIVFVLAAATDWLDGKLARAWNQSTPFGRMLDSIADKLLVGVTLLMLCAVGTIYGFHAFAAALILIREIAISGLREHLGERGVIVPVSMFGKWKTTFQLVALAALLLAPLMPWPWVSTVCGLVILWVAAVLTVVSGAEYAWGARHAFSGPAPAPREVGPGAKVASVEAAPVAEPVTPAAPVVPKE